MKLGYAGYYQFVTHRVDSAGEIIPGTEKVVLPWFKNLITNGGLDLLAQWSDKLGFARIGTGNSAPAFTDTGLGSQVAATSTLGAVNTGGVGPANAYLYRRVSRRFAAGSANGVNLAEVAMAEAATGQIFSRALLADSEGNPTTINLAVDEVLDVIYELRMYIDSTEVVEVHTIDGAPCTVTMRAHAYPTGGAWTSNVGNIGVGVLPGWWEGGQSALGTLADQPALSTELSNGGTGNTGPITWNAYTPGSYQRLTTLVVPLNVGNYPGGIGAIAAVNYNGWWAAGAPAAWSWGFSPKLNKTVSRTATVTLGISWGRHTP